MFFCATAHTCEPSAEIAIDVAACFTADSPPANFQLAPLSFETSTPPAVAANHALLANCMSLIWKATSCVFAPATGCLAVAAAPFRLRAGVATGVALATSNPALTHFPFVSSYFMRPPAFTEAHQPVGAAYTCFRSVRFRPVPSVDQVR